MCVYMDMTIYENTCHAFYNHNHTTQNNASSGNNNNALQPMHSNNNFNNNASTGVRSHFGSSSSLLSIATERACRQAFTKIPIGDLDAATWPSSTRERRRAT